MRMQNDAVEWVKLLWRPRKLKKRRANLESSRVWARTCSTWRGLRLLETKGLESAILQLCLPRTMFRRWDTNFSSLSRWSERVAAAVEVGVEMGLIW